MNTMIIKPDRQIVRNIGLFYACYRLSHLGWNVTLTAGLLKGVDVTAYKGDPSCSISARVRSLSRVLAVPLGPTLDGMVANYWIVLNNVASEKPSAFIL